MALRYSYTPIAPIYDAFVAPFTATARRQGLAPLPEDPTPRYCWSASAAVWICAAAARAALHRSGSDAGDVGALDARPPP